MSDDDSFRYVRKVSASKHNLWINRQPLLGRFDIELTERCNNNCIHCCTNLPQGDAQAKQRELSTSKVKNILTEAAGLGAISVRFTGGEPLLREDFADLYVFARRQGLKVLIFTNARLITPDLVNLFVRIPPLEKIEVSVYGMRRKSYEAVSRAKGSYKEFRRGVDLLLEHHIPFVAKGALLPPNLGDLDIFEAWASTIPGMTDTPNYAMFFDLRRRRDSPSKNRLIKRLRLLPHEGLAVLTRQRDKYLQDAREFCSKFMGPSGDLIFSCGSGHAPCVDAYGRLQPCLPLRYPEMVYDLAQGSLQDALTRFFPRLRQTKATNPDYLARCAPCFLKGLCEQCPAKSWAEHGTLDTPVEYHCRVAQAQARDLGLLREGEHPWEVKNWKERLVQI